MNNILYYYGTSDGKIFTDYNECWDYVRRHWYPNIKTFNADGMEEWRICNITEAIINTNEELEFLREGLRECYTFVAMPYGEVEVDTWVTLEIGYENENAFLVIPKSAYREDSERMKELMENFEPDCDLMKNLRP